jgi:hypothetical protein
MPLWRLMLSVNNSHLQPMGSGRSRLIVRLLITLLVSASLMLGRALTTGGA